MSEAKMSWIRALAGGPIRTVVELNWATWGVDVWDGLWDRPKVRNREVQKTSLRRKGSLDAAPDVIFPPTQNPANLTHPRPTCP